MTRGCQHAPRRIKPICNPMSPRHPPESVFPSESPMRTTRSTVSATTGSTHSLAAVAERQWSRNIGHPRTDGAIDCKATPTTSELSDSHSKLRVSTAAVHAQAAAAHVGGVPQEGSEGGGLQLRREVDPHQHRHCRPPLLRHRELHGAEAVPLGAAWLTGTLCMLHVQVHLRNACHMTGATSGHFTEKHQAVRPCDHEPAARDNSRVAMPVAPI